MKHLSILSSISSIFSMSAMSVMSVMSAGILTLLCASQLARAGEFVEEVKDAAPDSVVRVENIRGDVAIVGWDKNQVSVTGELDDLAEEFVFRVSGRKVEIIVKMPQKDVNWGDGSDLRIRIPERSRVSFEGVSTDLSIENVHGGAQLRTVSGDIDANRMSERLIVNTVSGDIEISGTTGRAQVSTISGDMDLVMSSREVKLDTVSGDIDIELKVFERLSSQSVSGEAEVRGELEKGGLIDMSSVSGDIELELVRPINAELRIRSGISGDIENDLSNHKPKDRFPSGGELDVTIGDGSGRISINTVTADIRLK